MGIPSFYAWLKKRYPLILFDITDRSKQIPIFDNLYIDFNALIYRCIRNERTFLQDQLNPQTFQTIYQNVTNYLNQLVDLVNPRKLLYISVDGVVPRAKINQSRQRRFKAGKHRAEIQQFYKEIQIQDKENFQDNSISPGTEFLFNLCTKLKSFVLNKIDSDWRKLKIIYSDCTCPGQGQQKIVQYLRFAQAESLFSQNTTHCVYSPDADFILLSLSTRLKYICLIRQEYNWSENRTYSRSRKQEVPKYQFVMINILAQYFELEFKELKQRIPNYDIKQIIDDFILMMMFVGNDFVPRLYSFNIKEGHIYILLEKYKQYLLNRNSHINNKGHINWFQINQLLKIIKEFELAMIREKMSKKNDKTILQDNGDDEEEIDFEFQDNDIVKGKNQYYKTRFNIDINTQTKQLEAIIVNYIEAIEFYCSYYYLGCQSWQWYYAYHYTPLISDVYAYLTKNKIQKVKLEPKGEPSDPLMALMMMVPQQSFKLLPNPLKQLLLNEENILRSPIDYYPLKFEFDKFTKKKDFDRRILIPFLNYQTVKSQYTKIKKQSYKPDQIQRNLKNRPLLFFRKIAGNRQISTGTQLRLDSTINSLRQILLCNSKQTRRRFPTLQIYGNTARNAKISLNLIVERRYNYKNKQNQLVFFNNFLGIIEQQQPIQREIEDRIKGQYAKIGIAGIPEKIYRVKLVRLVRAQDSFNLVKISRVVLVPDFALFEVPDYDYIKFSQNFSAKTLYEVNERIVILKKEYFGCQANILAINQNQVELKIVEKSISLQSRLQQYDGPYYTLNYVSQLLNMSKKLILVLMEPIYVKSSKKSSYYDLIPEQFDFGISILQRKSKSIIPQFIRCQVQYQNTNKPYQVFDSLEISQLGLELLQDYIKNFGEIVEAVQHEILKSKIFKGSLYVDNILDKQKIKIQDYNVELVRKYLKLFDLKNKGYFYTIYSKIAIDQPKFKINQVITIDKNIHHKYIMSKNQAKISALPYFSRQPQYHNIGDKVIILKTFQTGVIVGLDDDCIYVMFYKKGNQSYRFIFTEVFNEKWCSNLEKPGIQVWNQEVSYFSPSYWSKAIDIEQNN